MKHALHMLELTNDGPIVYTWTVTRLNGETISSSAFPNKAKAMSNCVDEMGDELLANDLFFFGLTFGQISLLRASARHRVPMRRPGKQL